MTSLSGIGSRAQNAVQSAWRGTCNKFQQAKEYVSPVQSEVKKQQDTSSPAAGSDLLKNTAKSAVAKSALGASSAKEKGALGLAGTALVTAALAFKRMKESEYSKGCAFLSSALAGAGVCLHKGMQQIATKFNPIASALNGVMHGASSSYDINKADSDSNESNKSNNRKNIEAVASGLLTAGASVKAAALVAAAGASPAATLGVTVTAPMIAAMGIARGVKWVSDRMPKAEDSETASA